jgi:hypothetical protein
MRRAVRSFRLDRGFMQNRLSRREYRVYCEELESLWPVIDAAHEDWARATGAIEVRGHPASFANLSPVSSRRLYALLRKLRPEVLVETGVCNGVSSAVILHALHANGRGRLHSVDFPEYAGTPSADHWRGKGGAVVPADQEPGWLVPKQLRGRWDLRLGRSQVVLPPLLRELGQIGFFMHDSEHSYECMRFEIDLASEHLAPGAPLVVDDANWSSAFDEFVRSRGLRSWDLDGGTYMTEMPPA